MIVPPETICAAFDKHLAVHAESWDIPHHVDCWGLAHAAFQQRSFPDFQKLYADLRGHWQVFRTAKNPPTAEAVYEMLGKIARP
jgi:hypothetical protein